MTPLDFLPQLIDLVKDKQKPGEKTKADVEKVAKGIELAGQFNNFVGKVTGFLGKLTSAFMNGLKGIWRFFAGNSEEETQDPEPQASAPTSEQDEAESQEEEPQQKFEHTVSDIPASGETPPLDEAKAKEVAGLYKFGPLDKRTGPPQYFMRIGKLTNLHPAAALAISTKSKQIHTSILEAHPGDDWKLIGTRLRYPITSQDIHNAAVKIAKRRGVKPETIWGYNMEARSITMAGQFAIHGKNASTGKVGKTLGLNAYLPMVAKDLLKNPPKDTPKFAQS